MERSCNKKPYEKNNELMKLLQKMSDRVDALEKLCNVPEERNKDDVNNKKYVPNKISDEIDSVTDNNEYDSSSLNDMPEMTVSPSNFAKIKNLSFGESIKILCMDNRKEGLIVKNAGTFTRVIDEAIENEKTNKVKKKKRKHRKRLKKSKMQPYKISTTKNSFSSTGNSAKSVREKAIADGTIIPTDKCVEPLIKRDKRQKRRNNCIK